MPAIEKSSELPEWQVLAESEQTVALRRASVQWPVAHHREARLVAKGRHVG
jgi:hypothetical protein